MIKYGDVLTDRSITIDIDRANREERLLDYGMNHVLSVVRITEYILEKLEYNEEYIEMAKIAALLHDIGKKKGERGHAKRGTEMTEKYLAGKDISEESKKEILATIENHCEPKKILSAMHACVILGDKLDLKKGRMLPGAYKDKNYKNIKYIDDVILEIVKKKGINTMYITYKVAAEFNKDIFRYFKRYILIPRMVANYFNMECIFEINDQIEAFNDNIWFNKEK